MSEPNLSLDALLTPPPLESAMAMAPSRVLETIILRFLARIINADGTIDPKELSMLVDISLQLGLEGPEAHRILDDEMTRKSDASQLAAQIPDPVQQREVYAMGCLMGVSDGSVATQEQEVLADFARGANIPAKDAGDILDAVIAAKSGAKSS
jgi:uncharacterized membrane protein YebE (DUF533 family)